MQDRQCAFEISTFHVLQFTCKHAVSRAMLIHNQSFPRMGARALVPPPAAHTAAYSLKNAFATWEVLDGLLCPDLVPTCVQKWTQTVQVFFLYRVA